MFQWLWRRQAGSRRRGRRPVRPRVEVLEDRCLLSNATPSVLPLTFEANQGQTDSAVQFLARGPGSTLFLTPDEAVLSLHQATGDAALRMHLVGAGANPQPVGLDPLAATSNYFVGNDPSGWHTGIRNYGRIAYQGVYPGIDLVYHGADGQLEYDFDVAPGADPARIGLAFQGASSMNLDAQGNLVLHTAAGDVVEQVPVLYQETAAGRQAVSGGYVLHADGSVGFRAGPYDPTLPLVIDPVLSYASFFGGTGWDQGAAVAVDPTGAAYVTGLTDSPSFPSLTAVRPLSGNRDAFVLKVNPDGSPAYFTYLGGTDNHGDTADDSGSGIAVDAAGNAYVTGRTQSFDFPTTAQAYQKASADAPFVVDAFVAKLNSAGGLVYSTYLGGTSDEAGNAIAVDPAGNAYVTGWTSSLAASFPTGLPGNGFQTDVIEGGHYLPVDGFLAKFDPTGSSLLYFTFIGGSDGNPNETRGNGVAVDGAGNAYVTGTTDVANLPVTAGALQPTLAGFHDAFVLKVNTNLSGTASIVYGTYLGGSENDSANGIALDAQGDAYVAGATTSPSFPAAATLQPLVPFQSSEDGFVAKVAADGSALDYFTYLDGSAAAIAVDGAGTAYVTGEAAGDFHPLVHPLVTTWAGAQAFLTALNTDGTAALYSTIVGSDGGFGGNQGQGVAVDGAGNVWVTGAAAASFLTTANAPQATYGGGFQDAFLLRVTPLTGNVQFSVPTADVHENAGSVTLTLARTGGSEGALTVHYATSDGTALAGADYLAASGDITFQDGETSKTIDVAVLPDHVVEGNETFNVTLTGPAGRNAAAVVTLIDDTPAPAPPPPANDGPGPGSPGAGEGTASGDVTGQVVVPFTRTAYSAARRQARMTLTLQNSGGFLQGPFWLVLDGLPRRVKLRRPAGLTLGGSPFVFLGVAALNPGDGVTLTLDFANAPSRHVFFTPRLLAGSPPVW